MKITDVNAAIEWLNQQKNTPQNNGVEKVTMALEFLGNPHFGLPAIHITGTNGKGSTTAFIRDLLLSQGLTVGTFTSPHIMKFNERFTYNGEMISDEELLMVVNEMIAVNDYMAESAYGRLVFFELYTVMMALYFQMKQPDVCIVEVGIGGFHDCTIVVDAQLAVITTIGLDHGDKLGNTVEEVAYEKSGIIKAGSVVVTGLIGEGPLQVIEARAAEMNVPLYRYQKDYGMEDVLNHLEHGSTFNFWQKVTQLDDITQNNFALSMLGTHQIQNATVALQAFDAWMNLIEQPIDWIVAKPALHQTKWIARMERISDAPMVYIDGAHNVAGLTALKNLMNEFFPHKTIHLLYAGLETKNQRDQLPLLASFEPKSFKVTTFGHYQALQQADYQNLLDTLPAELSEQIVFEDDWKTYVRNFLDQYDSSEDHLLLVTGSLYFVSEIRNFFVHQLQKCY